VCVTEIPARQGGGILYRPIQHTPEEGGEGGGRA